MEASVGGGGEVLLERRAKQAGDEILSETTIFLDRREYTNNALNLLLRKNHVGGLVRKKISCRQTYFTHLVVWRG
jgi:hypothetical protein